MMLFALLHLCLASDPKIPPKVLELPEFELDNSNAWYIDHVVSHIDVVIEGQQPLDDLPSLLEVQVGDSLSLIHIRKDIQILHLTGSYASIEAHVSRDSSVDGVLLTYVMRPAPRIEAIEINGAPRTLKKLIQKNIGLAEGQVFYPVEGQHTFVAHVNSLAQKSGWPNAQITMKPVVKDYNYELNFNVLPGEEQLYGKIRIEGLPKGLGVSYHWLRLKHRILKNQRFSAQAIKSFQEDLQTLLVQQGWLQAVVNRPKWQTKNGDIVLIMKVEARSKVSFLSKSKGIPPGEDLRKILGVYPGDRVSVSNADIYTSKLKSWMKSRGYNRAKVDVEVRDTENEIVVVAKGKKGPHRRLVRILIDNARSIPQQQLLNSVTGEIPSLDDRIYIPEDWERAVSLLQEVYRSQGYLQATVKSLPPLISNRKGLLGEVSDVVVRARVVEGPLTTLLPIEATGGVSQVMDSIQLPQSGPYQPKKIELLLSEIKRRHQEAGFLNAQVEKKVVLHPSNHTAHVTYAITPNDSVFLRSVSIQGNKRTKSHIIHDSILMEVDDPIESSKVSETRKRLYKLDVFRSVQLTLLGDEPTHRDMLIEVVERPNLVFSLGGSIATDQGVQVNTSVGHRNLFGLAHQLTFLGRTGYGWDGDSWKLDDYAPVWGAALRYTAPRTPRKDMELYVEGLFRDQIQEANYRLDNSGAAIGWRMRFSSAFESLMEYRVRYTSVEDYEPGMIVLGEIWDDMLPLIDSRWSSAFQISSVLDRRNNPLNPTEGSLLSQEIVLGDGLLSNDPYVICSYNISQIWNFDTYRIKLDHASGVGKMRYSQTLPFENRFSLGGASTIRGFYRNSIGPANYSRRPSINYPSQIGPLIESTALREKSSQWIATGGDYFSLVSTELQIPLGFIGWTKASQIFFYDVGKLGFLSSEIKTYSVEAGLEPFLRYSIGTGFRYATPIGPVVIDIGFNPKRRQERGEEWLLTHFSLGAL